MFLLPPGFLPLPVASLYLIGCTLEEVSNRDPDEESVPGLDIAIRPFARRRPRPQPAPNGLPRLVQVYSLVVTDVHPVPMGDGRTRDLFDTAVAITFEDENRRAFYRGPDRDPGPGVDEDDIAGSSSSVDRLRVVLRHPVSGCLSKKRVRDNLNATGLIAAFAPLPDDFELSISPIEETVVSRFRQALALGLLKASLVYDRHRIAPIPADFWRTDAALPLMTEKAITSLEVEGRPVQGHVFVDLQHLRADWRRAFSQLPSSSFLAAAEFCSGDIPPLPLATPYIAFLEKVASALGYVGGVPTRWDLSIEQIAQYIERRWNTEEVGKLGAYVTGMGTAMARLIANPGVLKPGRPQSEVGQQRIEWQRQFEREFDIRNDARA